MAVRLCFPLIATLCIFATWPVYAPVPTNQRNGSLAEPQSEVEFKPHSSTSAHTTTGSDALNFLESIEPTSESEMLETLDYVEKNWWGDEKEGIDLESVRMRLFEVAGGNIKKIVANSKKLLEDSNLSPEHKNFLMDSVRVTLWSSDAAHVDVDLEVSVPVKLHGHIKVGHIAFPRIVYQTLVVDIRLGEIAKMIKTLKAASTPRDTIASQVAKKIRSKTVTSYSNRHEAAGNIGFDTGGWQVTIDGTKVKMDRSPIHLEGTLEPNSAEGESVFRISRTQGSYQTNQHVFWVNDHPYDYQGEVRVAADGTVRVKLDSYVGSELYWKEKSWWSLKAWFSLRTREIWDTEIDSDFPSQLTGSCGDSFHRD